MFLIFFDLLIFLFFCCFSFFIVLFVVIWMLVCFLFCIYIFVFISFCVFLIPTFFCSFFCCFYYSFFCLIMFSLVLLSSVSYFDFLSLFGCLLCCDLFTVLLFFVHNSLFLFPRYHLSFFLIPFLNFLLFSFLCLCCLPVYLHV